MGVAQVAAPVSDPGVPGFFNSPTFGVLALAALAAVIGAAYGSRIISLKDTAQDLEESVDRQQAILAALKEREERFAALLEHSSDALVVLDSTRHPTYVSSSSERVAGRSRDELINRGFKRFLHPDDLDSLRDAWQQICASPGVPVRFSFRLRHRDGSWRKFAAIAQNALDQPVVGGVIINARDVTDEEATADMLRQAQKMDAVGRVAAGVAHDFNNLLTVISANASLLRRELRIAGMNDSSAREIEAAADGGARLTRQLLTFSRKEVINPTVIELNSLVEATTPLLQRLVGEDVKLNVARSAGPATVRIDRAQIEQVLLNLVLNAAQAMPGGGEVRLEIRTRALQVQDELAASGRGSVTLTVTDTGVGMDDSIRSRLFEPFFTTRPTGTGLGLATVQWIVGNAGGTIRVVSSPGQGTKVEISFPSTPMKAAGEEGAEAIDEQPRTAPVGHGATATILLAEDEELVRKVATRVLAKNGYTVLAAESGESAMVIARNHRGRIDLLLTDLVMPGMTGRQLSEQFCELYPDTPTLYMSGYTDDEIVRRGVAMTTISFLQKPFAIESLLTAVREAIDSFEARRAPSE